jgi:hypothetical protein
MTASERTSYFNNEVALEAKKYGINLSDRPLPQKPNVVDKKTG